jgi:predicted metal-binding protein
MYRLVKPVIDKTVRYLCCKEYDGHPKGCPNFGKNKNCPPERPLLGDIIDLNQDVFVIWNVFDFGAHVEKMRQAHPNWSKRQLECCLYWQNTARKQLRQQVADFETEHLFEQWEIVYIPEACGVNITETMLQIDEVLEWAPVNKTYQVALAGKKILQENDDGNRN